MERKFPITGKKCVSKPRQSRKRPGCIRLFVCPTTGGRLEISVSPRESILGLKTALARKLKTNPARITLIYKEKALTSGRLIDYKIPEDGLLTLLPNMESGLSLHQSEKSITQALENLSETQVNDFLSGRAPLMLAMRMGENMVFVQLQLSTVQGQGQAQGQGISQPRPSVTSMTPRTAALLSHGGLSASALAQATRCLSRRIHHLQEVGKTSAQAPHHMPVNPNQISRASTVPLTTASLPATPPPSPSPSPTSSSPPSPLSSDLASSSPVMMATSAPIAAPIPTAAPTNLAPAMPSDMKPSHGPALLQLPTSSPLPTNLPSSSSVSSPLPSPPPSPRAVINSLKHVGSGVYSGTFSGTLDPSLQEANGQPRKSVHTILHILNDLLVASPKSSPQPQAGTQPHFNSQPQTSTEPSSPMSLSQNQPQQIFFNQNSILTPSSPKHKESVGPFTMEKADNELLRGKMQRVQMMLAQRKEQRGRRRQAVAPYPQQMNSIGQTQAFNHLCPTDSATDMDIFDTAAQPSSTIASTAETPSASPSASSSPSSERARINTHVDDGGECCGNYGNKGLEHDSLVV